MSTRIPIEQIEPNPETAAHEDAYEPPRITVLGNLRDVRGGTGSVSDFPAADNKAGA